MSEAIKQMFTDISKTYDKLNHVLSLNIDKIWRKKSVKKINKKPHENICVLDLCAGTHDLGLAVHQKFVNAQIFAVDFSFGMLASGQKKIATLRNNNKIIPICADALRLPFTDNTFDVILCAYGVRNIDNKKMGLVELHRVLKPNGQLIVLEFFKPTNQFSKLFHKTYARYVLPRMGQLISGNKSAYEYLKNSIQGFMSVDEFSILLKESGYSNIQKENFFLGISSCVWAKKSN